MSAESHLAEFGITVQQARDFIKLNIQEPEEIFQVARDYGVTTRMLSELSDHSVDAVRGYFSAVNLQSKDLDYPNILVNSDLGSLGSLVSLNQREGILSNTSLRTAVLEKLGSNKGDYEFTFGFVKPYQDDDGIYNADELGVGHLTSVPATTESLESLFYGSLINIFSALDEIELNQIVGFSNKGTEEYQTLFLSTLSESPTPIMWSDTDLSHLVEDEVVSIIGKYWEKGNYLAGLLDHSYLGIATA
ncbi:MAG: hypothetical protein AABY47_06915 [Pseudomonadota bacterium]